MTDKSLTDKLFGVFNMYSTGKPDITKADIKKAVEKGFIQSDM